VIAHVVAAPVVGRRVEAPYGDDGGFVTVVVARGGPLLPNGVVLTGPVGRGPVVTRGAQVWDPVLREVAAGRGDEILDALGARPGPLADAVADRDPQRAGAVAAGLVGRGRGLTPEGDDAIAATAAVVASGPWPAREKAAWLAALVGERLRERTSALSATLIELAVTGAIAEPVHAVLAGARWQAALPRLTAMGHSTGRVYAVNAATAARALGYVSHGVR
jgi:hypothetical protein